MCLPNLYSTYWCLCYSVGNNLFRPRQLMVRLVLGVEWKSYSAKLYPWPRALTIFWCKHIVPCIKLANFIAEASLMQRLDFYFVLIQITISYLPATVMASWLFTESIKSSQ